MSLSNLRSASKDERLGGLDEGDCAAGLERILRRIFQFLISALACSPGPRRWAWAVLMSFWWQFDWSLEGVAHRQVAWIRSSAACSANGLVISL
jgi:hypothetical protein